MPAEPMPRDDRTPEGLLAWNARSSMTSGSYLSSVYVHPSEELGAWPAVTPEIYEVEALLAEFARILEELRGATQEPVPEVFDLRPISRRRVSVRVRNRGPARFYFVDDPSELEVED